jgi:hypothetical protein
MRSTNYYRVIRILQVEGNDRHAERVRLHLYASGLRCAIRRVTSRDDYVSALRQSWPDVVVAGGDLPMLDVPTALDIAADEAPYVPTVFATMDRLTGLGEVILGSMVQAREVRGRRLSDRPTLRAA